MNCTSLQHIADDALARLAVVTEERNELSKQLAAAISDCMSARTALQHIMECTDADNPESYRSDDREGALDHSHYLAKMALEGITPQDIHESRPDQP